MTQEVFGDRGAELRFARAILAHGGVGVRRGAPGPSPRGPVDGFDTRCAGEEVEQVRIPVGGDARYRAGGGVAGAVVR